MSFRPTRRTVLRGAAGTLVSLPLLASRARAQGGAPWPLRFVDFFTPNGTNPETWWPPEGSTERDWIPGRVLRPLTPFQQRPKSQQGHRQDRLAIGRGGGVVENQVHRGV